MRRSNLLDDCASVYVRRERGKESINTFDAIVLSSIDMIHEESHAILLIFLSSISAVYTRRNIRERKIPFTGYIDIDTDILVSV